MKKVKAGEDNGRRDRASQNETPPGIARAAIRIPGEIQGTKRASFFLTMRLILAVGFHKRVLNCNDQFGVIFERGRNPGFSYSGSF